MSQTSAISTNLDSALNDIQRLIEQSRERVTSYVNSTMTLMYWLIGQRIQQELLTEGRAAYGDQIFATLSQELTLRYGKGFNKSALSLMSDKQIARNFEELGI